MSTQGRFRKQLFVSGRIQGRLTTWLVSFWIIHQLVLWHTLFAYQYAQQRLAGAGDAHTLTELYGEFLGQYYPLMICSLALLPVFCLDLIRLTHRVAGPLVRIQRTLREMAQGEPVQPIHLRKGDLLDELVDAVNACIAAQSNERRPAVSSNLTREQADLLVQILPDRAAAPAEPVAVAP